MNTLGDEILAALPGLMATSPRGATVKAVCLALTVDGPHAREAMRYLDTTGRAVFMRYPDARTQYLIPLDHDIGFLRVCAHCRVAFDPMGAKRQCCTRSCANAWSWGQPGAAEKRSAAIKASKATPEAKEWQRKHNERRWSDPEQRAKLSAQNRREWADPAKKAQRSASIQAAQGSPEKRAEYRDIRKALWDDPEYRERTTEAVREARRRPEVRAKISEGMRRRWQDPVMRAKYIAANQRKAADRKARSVSDEALK